MGLVQTRDFKTALSKRYNGSKIYPNINADHMNQLPSNIKWTHWIATTKWTIHIPSSNASYIGAGVIELTHYRIGSNNAVYMGTQGGNVAGMITAITSNVGSGYFGLEITTANVSNCLYMLFIEGRVSYFNGL